MKNGLIKAIAHTSFPTAIVLLSGLQTTLKFSASVATVCWHFPAAAISNIDRGVCYKKIYSGAKLTAAMVPDADAFVSRRSGEHVFAGRIPAHLHDVVRVAAQLHILRLPLVRHRARRWQYAHNTAAPQRVDACSLVLRPRREARSGAVPVQRHHLRVRMARTCRSHLSFVARLFNTIFLLHSLFKVFSGLCEIHRVILRNPCCSHLENQS